MSKIKLTGESSGYVEISAGNAAGNNTLEAPTSGTRLVAHEGSQDVILNGNLTVNGVLSYEDTTNIDSVGLITARNGLHVTDGSVGIGTDNPTKDLTITGNNPGILLKEDSANSELLLTVSDSDGTGVIAATRPSNYTYEQLAIRGQDLIFETTSTQSRVERLRITSAGLVGVNCNPLSQFQVKTGTNQNIAFSSMSSEASIEAFNDAGSANVPLRLRGSELKFYISGTERLKIDSNGSAQFTGANSPSGRNTRISQYGSLLVATTGEILSNARCSIDAGNGNITTEGGVAAASVNLQSSSTNSWFQTGASYGGTNYVWAAKDSSANVWHSGLQTDGDLYLGGDITGTRNISLNGSNGSASFTGKVDIGSSYSGGEILLLGKSSGTSYTGYRNGGTYHGFIGHADQLVSGGSGTDFAIRSTNNLVFATNGNNERLRITSNGRLLLGHTSLTGDSDSAYSRLVVNGNTQASSKGGIVSLEHTQPVTNIYNNHQLGQIFFKAETGEEFGLIKVEAQGNASSTSSRGRMMFSTTNTNATTPTERMRIDCDGATTLRAANYGLGVRSIAGSSSVNTAYFGAHSSGAMTTGTITFEVYTNGTVKNATGTYGSLSDERLKENIIDAPSQWDDIKSLRIRKYNFRDNNEYETHTQIGLVAQETESVCPGLVQETPVREDATPVLDGDGNALETTKSVSTSVLYMKAVKALQEAQTRIETLETQLTDALARIAALEG